MFKADVVNFILSSPLLAVRLPSSVKNQDNHLYEDYIKSGKLKKQLEGKWPLTKGINAENKKGIRWTTLQDTDTAC